MAYKRDVVDVITDYNTGTYNNLSLLYSYLVDTVTPSYYVTEVCLDDLFSVTHTATTCGTNYDSALAVITILSESDLILAYELFGYEYAFYLDDCDDNGGCLCDNRNYNGRNVVSKRQYGVLTDNGYLLANYSRQYLTQLHYSEDSNTIYLSNEHSSVNPPTNSTYYSISNRIYKNKMILTYVGFDKTNARFLEQVLLDGQHSVNGVWGYALGSTTCYHNNTGSTCEVQENFNTVSIVVEYISDAGILNQIVSTNPIVYSMINYEDGKAKVDGVYKTYYFEILSIPSMFIGTIGTNVVFESGSFFYFEYLDTNGVLIKEYVKLNYTLSISYTGNIITVSDSYSMPVSFDMTNQVDISNFRMYITGNTGWFTTATAVDFLNGIGTFRNIINSSTSLLLDNYVGEDSHLVTYDLRGNIIDSITGCEIPCEKFSFDTWVALMQKKMAANVAFCNNNLQETARVMSTVEERCKNCD